MRAPGALRSWSAEDAAARAKLYARNRDDIEQSEPWRAPSFFTTGGQPSRLTTAAAEERARRFHGWVIVEGEEVAGTVALEDVRRGDNQDATIGYWVDHDHQPSARRR
jgi:[ribosomal protein S5]-alanine N-acetyltransferase